MDQCIINRMNESTYTEGTDRLEHKYNTSASQALVLKASKTSWYYILINEMLVFGMTVY